MFHIFLRDNIDTRHHASLRSRRGVSIRCSLDRLENSHVQFALDTLKHAVFVHVLKKI